MAQNTEDPSVKPTAEEAYTQRLVGLEPGGWKRWVDARLYRRNVRRLFGERAVLDIGCGIGGYLSYLAPGSVGVDHNVYSVELCRQRRLSAYSVTEFFGTQPARLGSFGGLLAAHLVEHMPPAEAESILRSYLDYLAPDALMVLICPQERGYQSDPTHVNFADFGALGELVRNLGFTEQRHYSFPFPRAFGRFFTYNEFILVGRKI